MTEFGRLLKHFRERRMVSQYALAKKAKTSHTTIYRLEQGSRNPSPEMAARMAAALDLGRNDRASLLRTVSPALLDPGDTLRFPILAALDVSLVQADPHIREDALAALRTVLRSLTAP